MRVRDANRMREKDSLYLDGAMVRRKVAPQTAFATRLDPLRSYRAMTV